MASEVPLKFTTTINDLRDDGLFNLSTEPASNNKKESATVSTTEVPSSVDQAIGNQGITSSLSTPTSLFPTLESDLTLIECGTMLLNSDIVVGSCSFGFSIDFCLF